MKDKQVRTKAELDAIWPQVQPLFEASMWRGTDNHVTPADIYVATMKGLCHIFYVLEDDGTVPLALAIEPLNTYRGLVYMVIALGGKDLDKYYDAFWNNVLTWMHMNGAVAVEALVRPAMRRWLTKYNFEPVCTQMRLTLGE